MIRLLSAAIPLALTAAASAADPSAPVPTVQPPPAAPAPAAPLVAAWTPDQIARLRHWVQDAPRDALPLLSTASLDRAAAGDQAQAAQAIALELARLHLHGSAGTGARAGWNIADTGDGAGLEAGLNAAVAAGALDRFMTGLRPRHPDYAVLRAALGAETDPVRRTALARNMERWRWMPLELGREFVLVNAAVFQATLWRGPVRAGTWPVIVGKPKTPTPVFAATITGVTFNPWWEIPASIVRESVGAMVRRNPAAARQRGYVWSAGRYRQRPGPGNALGQMKLTMPNPYNVYLHDTPTKQLFTQDVRAFSHGCVRVGDAIGFAATLVAASRTRAEVDAIVRSGQTTQVSTAAPLPVYIAYFTASTNERGELVFAPDIYGRDKRVPAVAARQTACRA